MKYCSNCGNAHLQFIIPEGDHLKRFVCNECNTVHYINPNMVVGCLVENKGKIMMARRGIEPRKGFWNLPCGFLENNETISEGAIREVKEETGAEVKIHHLHTIYNLTKANQVYLIFQSEMVSTEYYLTEESTEIKFFNEKDMPWEDIAFSSNTFALRKYFEKETPLQEQLFLGSYDE